ncbi:nucleotidyltransferase domain-containing protein [Candidatus Pacearchaeota archaeon]|nr:nucleotidyltransferase domain-containing protein [Candidatus Pacearchaeota archaeon]
MKDLGTEIPGMNLSNNYSPSPVVPQVTPESQGKMDKTKKSLDKLKDYILKKYKFTQALSVLPPQSIPIFIKEEEVPKETEKYMHLYMIVPEAEFKNIKKISAELVKKIDEMKIGEKIWLQVKTPVDVWENCMDSKFDLAGAIAMSYPIYDTNFLSNLRVAEIHKSLVLRKFEKYVVSYVVAGSLVRGDTTATSDVDVFIIINDTDVKQMPRLELKERLRSIIFKYIDEASALAGVKRNVLNVQPYLLTDFWESVKDAHPVMFTFIRDGVPLYDRGTFLPWKALLKMGKLKPSPEAIDMFMSTGDKTVTRAKRALLDILVHDIYWGVLTPTQGILMLHGLAPPTPKQTVTELKRVFVTEEKMLEMKYVKIVEEVIKYYKDYEHEKVKEVSGKEIDRLLKNTEDYLKRLKVLRVEIEKRAQKKTIDQLYDDAFKLLKNITGKKSQVAVVESFEKDFVKAGKFTNQHSRMLSTIIDAKNASLKGKTNLKKVNSARKQSSLLINDLIEYAQRCDLVLLDKNKMTISYSVDGKNQIAELFNYDKRSFLIRGSSVVKLTDKVSKSSAAEVTEAIEKQKEKESVSVSPRVFELIKKELGEFEIIL